MRKHFSKLSFATAFAAVAFASCNQSELTNISTNTETLVDSKFAAISSIGEQVVPNEVLVRFADGMSQADIQEVISMVGGKQKEHILTAAMRSEGDKQGIYLLSVNMTPYQAMEKLKGVRGVEFAEPNFIYNHSATSNDPLFTNGYLWGTYGSATTPANQYGTGAATTWANGKVGSSTVYVGIIDEGYMYTHTDLAANAGTNPLEVAGNGVDDDGNGYIDDKYGWDFDGNNNTVFDGVNDDHGTHVAGTIGAKGGNGLGSAGMCWNVKLLNAKFLGTSGGTTANAIKAVDYFTDLKVRAGINIVATNNSWGGGGYSQALFDAITRANNRGILFIAAAGNNSSNNDAVANYPSNYNVANVIAVAAITSSGALSSFSNYGATQVDLGAPGSAIYSTVPTTSNGVIVSAYAGYDGTSMATPHVTGAAALYASINPSASMATIKSAILSSVTPTASLSGKCVTGGRLNVAGF